MRKFISVLVILLAAVIAVSCGPARKMKVLGPNQVSDYAVFEGTVVSSPAQVRVIVDDQFIDVGYKLSVLVSEGDIRTIYCPSGKIAVQCSHIGIGSRVAVNGQPIGATQAYQVSGIRSK